MVTVYPMSTYTKMETNKITKWLMSLFVIADIILLQPYLFSFPKAPVCFSDVWALTVLKKSGSFWVAYLIPASTGFFSKFSIIWTWGRKNGKGREDLERQTRDKSQRQPERKTEEETDTRRERSSVRGINRDSVVDAQMETQNVAEQTDRQTTMAGLR